MILDVLNEVAGIDKLNINATVQAFVLPSVHSAVKKDETKSIFVIASNFFRSYQREMNSRFLLTFCEHVARTA
jgi:hypothetical protein